MDYEISKKVCLILYRQYPVWTSPIFQVKFKFKSLLQVYTE